MRGPLGLFTSGRFHLSVPNDPGSFTGNGRRIECGTLADEELARLIRVAEQRFRWPESSQGHSMTMRAEELAMLVNGLDVTHTRQRNWYRKSA